MGRGEFGDGEAVVLVCWGWGGYGCVGGRYHGLVKYVCVCVWFGCSLGDGLLPCFVCMCGVLLEIRGLVGM